MDTANGELDPSLARAIISKYLSVNGNELGSTELNAIGGQNLCSLDIEVLRNISSQNIRDAEGLDVSNCTSEKQRALFNTARQAFITSRNSDSVSVFQLLQPYLGGAPSEYIQSLSGSNVNMDLRTFVNLDEEVVQSLTVEQVKGLVGDNLADLKSFENNPVVRSWITNQLQSDLDKLGINLVGGRADPTTNSQTTKATTQSVTKDGLNVQTTTTTTATTTPTTTTTAAGVRMQGDVACFTFLVFLGLLISSQQI
ncbi:PREDICTED: mesothelin-like protein [Cyprinodon variegatus]|uniref:mesothelin-like protein n=1 Tax=Cyprinodon variegatus TaxID=28743 RepID=UPI0007426C31|nr:PREDICTED: mesothelin-like protein [Cyprinodon variegatus]